MGVWKIEQTSRCCKEKKKTNFILDKSEEAGSHWQAPRHTLVHIGHIQMDGHLDIDEHRGCMEEGT